MREIFGDALNDVKCWGWGTQGITKFSVAKAKIVRSTHLHLNRRHFFSINLNDLIPIGINRYIFKVQTFQILKFYAKLSPI
jgi:hypothetical protein